MIRVENLTKEFRVLHPIHGFWGHIKSLVHRPYTMKRAVDSISFEIAPGELVGYLGPNGAGKSTTIKMLTGILVPSSGHVEVLGKTPWKARQELAYEISVVFGQRQQTWWELPLIDSLNMQRYLYSLRKDRFDATLQRLSDLLGLEEFIHTPVRQLSLGQRMRGEVAMALLHEPRIIYLDEPTIGMDVLAKERLRGFIKTLNDEFGVTVLLTTHDMGDIERLCKRIIIIDHGRLLYDGTLDELKSRYGSTRHVVFEFETPIDNLEVTGATRVEQRTQTMCKVSFDRDSIAVSDLIAQVTARYPVRDLTLEEPQIETIVQEIYAEAEGKYRVTA